MTCKKCDKIFETLHTYDAQVGICDGEDRYKCLGCKTCFTDRKKAYNHMYNCHKKLSGKRCNLPFQESKSLLKHCEIAHPKGECQICHSFLQVMCYVSSTSVDIIIVKFVMWEIYRPMLYKKLR